MDHGPAGAVRVESPSFLTSLVATMGVAAAPAFAAFSILVFGQPHPHVLLACIATIPLTLGAIAIGSRIWRSQPESEGMPFGDLMLWSWIRCHHAEQMISSALAILGFDGDGRVAHSDATTGQRIEALRSLATALDAKSSYTLGHSRRVERHARKLASKLGLDKVETESLALAASLHDVPSVMVSDSVVRKAAELTPGERSLVAAGVVSGNRLLRQSAPHDVVDGVVLHHERWDGSGYPNGLRGEQIPSFARMIAIVEAYDAMTSTRPYRQGLSRKTAVETLVASSGTQFDGALVDTFVTTLRRPMLGTSSSPVLSTIETQFRELFVGLRRVGAVALSATASTIAIALILGSGALSPGTPTTPAVAAPQRHSSLADDEVLGTRVDLPSAPGDTGAETGGGADDIGGVSQTPDTTDQTLTSDGVTFTASIDEAIADDLGSDPGGTDPGTEPGPGTGGSEGGGPSQPPPDAGGGSEQPPPPDSGQPPPDSGGGSAEQPPDGGSGPEQPPPSDPKDKNPDANGNGHAYGHDKKDDGSTGP